jgi:hypothetical protein
MIRKLILISAAVIVLAAALRATTVKKMELTEMVSVSDAIAHGTVESVESRWEDQSIYTYTSIRVDENLKGGPRRALLIRQAGGTVGSLVLNIPGMPQFKHGDQVIVFLRDRKNGTFDVIGMNQGKYDIRNDVAMTNAAGMTLLDPKTGKATDAGGFQKQPVEAFKAKIRELVR